MPLSPKPLYVGQPGTSTGTLYTVPASTKVLIKEMIFTNTGTAVKHVTIYLVESGGTANAARATPYQLPIEAKRMVVIPLNTILDAASTIQGQQETASTITVRISGVEIS